MRMAEPPIDSSYRKNGPGWRSIPPGHRFPRRAQPRQEARCGVERQGTGGRQAGSHPAALRNDKWQTPPIAAMAAGRRSWPAVRSCPLFPRECAWCPGLISTARRSEHQAPVSASKPRHEAQSFQPFLNNVTNDVFLRVLILQGRHPSSSRRPKDRSGKCSTCGAGAA